MSVACTGQSVVVSGRGPVIGISSAAPPAVPSAVWPVPWEAVVPGSAV